MARSSSRRISSAGRRSRQFSWPSTRNVARRVSLARSSGRTTGPESGRSLWATSIRRCCPRQAGASRGWSARRGRTVPPAGWRSGSGRLPRAACMRIRRTFLSPLRLSMTTCGAQGASEFDRGIADLCWERTGWTRLACGGIGGRCRKSFGRWQVPIYLFCRKCGGWSPRLRKFGIIFLGIASWCTDAPGVGLGA